MAIINLAYTGTINPKGATPILTAQQVWAGLERKVRRGQDFVPVIEKTTVVSEQTASERSHPHLAPGVEIVVREATFTPNAGPAMAQMNDGRVEETCVLYAPNRVDFLQADGSTVSNIVSQGPGGEGDLKMTYAFSWRHGELDATKDRVAVEHMRSKYQKTAEMAVEKTIESMREMIKKGDIGEYEVVRKGQ